MTAGEADEWGPSFFGPRRQWKTRFLWTRVRRARALGSGAHQTVTTDYDESWYVHPVARYPTAHFVLCFLNISTDVDATHAEYIH